MKKTPDIFDESCDRLKVGLCQVATEKWDVAGNLKRTCEALNEAARKGAELCVTPECVLHGYATGRGDAFMKRLRKAAESTDGPAFLRLRKTAHDLKMAVALGFAEAGEDGAVHNSTALISGGGEILAVYRKVHCRPGEDAGRTGCFTPGGQFEVVDMLFKTRRYNIGVMICFDREVPESVRCLRALGAEIVVCPLATDTENMNAVENSANNEMITRCRAAENELFIVVVNHAQRFNGGSFVVGPGGECLHQMGQKAGVAVVDVPVGAIRKLFHEKPLGWMGWGYRRPDVYRKYLAR